MKRLPGDLDRSDALRLLLAWIDEAMGTFGAYETELLRQEARQAGRLTASARLLEADNAMLPAFALPSQEMIDRIFTDAKLTDREWQVSELAMVPMQSWEIAKVITPMRQRRMGSTVAVETIERLWRSARAKMQALLHVGVTQSVVAAVPYATTGSMPTDSVCPETSDDLRSRT